MAAAAADAEVEAEADADIRIIACGAGVMPDVIRDDAFLFYRFSDSGLERQYQRKILI
jgi:hypothetical protein